MPAGIVLRHLRISQIACEYHHIAATRKQETGNVEAGVEVMNFTGMVIYMTVSVAFTGYLAHTWRHLSWKRWMVYAFIWSFFGLFMVPWIILFFKSKGDQGSVNSAASQDFALGAKYSYTCGSTGLAMDTDQNILRVKNGSFIKEYPFTDVREWRANLVSGGGVVGVGAVGGMAAVGQTIRANRENAKASGFYIKVKDIDNPEWRVEMPSQDNQNRWMEIFNQLINKN